MSRYTGPKARINRRLGLAVFESAGALKATDRKPGPPGMHPPPRKLSKHGEGMREKQKIKYYYGLGEKSLRRLFAKARHQEGNTGDNVLLMCERRLDSVIRQAGLTKTRPQARQGVAHGHFLVNGRKTDIASMMLRAGDVVDVKRRPGITTLYQCCLAETEGRTADWLALDAKKLRIIVERLPAVDDITLPVDVAMVVELLSR